MECLECDGIDGVEYGPVVAGTKNTLESDRVCGVSGQVIEWSEGF
jgi:hypothetical protein